MSRNYRRARLSSQIASCSTNGRSSPSCLRTFSIAAGEGLLAGDDDSGIARQQA